MIIIDPRIHSLVNNENYEGVNDCFELLIGSITFRKDEKMKISIVIPCYRSEKTIETVYLEIVKEFEKKKQHSYEIIAVNDCSPDNVLEVLIKLAQKDPCFKVIDCAKNMGKHAALMAGFHYAAGDYIVCMDDDGQCPTEYIWDLITPLEEGYDLAMAKYGTKTQSRFKNFGSKMNDWMMTTALGKPKDFQFANFCAFKAFVVKEIIKYDEPYSYVNGLLLRTTRNIINIPMQERERFSGTGGYNFRKSLELWLNGIIGYSVLPLKIAFYAGVLFSLIGLLVGIVSIITKITSSTWTPGVMDLIGIILFAAGIIMFFWGS